METPSHNAHPPILGISEIVLSVADLPRMREFYREVLGFALHHELSMETESPVPDGEPTIAFLEICGSETPLGRNGHPQLLALIDYKRHHFARMRFRGHDVTVSTLNHLAFEIPSESFDAHLQNLQRHHIEATQSRFPDMSARAVFFRDPEGNTLELICHDSAMEH